MKKRNRCNAAWFMAVMLLIMPVKAELLENVSFAKDFQSWFIGVSSEYGGIKPVFDAKDGALTARGLNASQPGYLTVMQAVDIRKDKRYRLAFESRGEATGSYVVSIQHVGKDRHFVKPALQTTASWQQHEFEFAGKYDTDPGWFKDWRREAKRAEFKSGRTISKKLGELSLPSATDDYMSSLIFSIGGLTGTFELRNVTITELE